MIRRGLATIAWCLTALLTAAVAFLGGVLILAAEVMWPLVEWLAAVADGE